MMCGIVYLGFGLRLGLGFDLFVGLFQLLVLFVVSLVCLGLALGLWLIACISIVCRSLGFGFFSTKVCVFVVCFTC